MNQVLKSRRWTREDWVRLAVERLKRDGPSALTLDQLCLAAGRTRGSFYHHFAAVDLLVADVAERWRETETEQIAARTLSESDALSGLALMTKLTDAIDHRLERGVRIMATTNKTVHAIVEGVDVRREVVMRDLLMRGYALGKAEAASASRLFHALHQAAVMRSPDDIRGYTRATIRSLVGWLSRDATSKSEPGVSSDSQR